jgi:hypothetical protein
MPVGGKWYGALAALLLLGAMGRTGQAAPPPSFPGFAGHTLSAFTYVSRHPDQRAVASLSRIMFQAYLEPGGRALVRVWDEARDAYTSPAERSWRLDGDRLCLDLPRPGRAICAAVHVWGPRIAGIGISPYVMLDGDLEPGNTIGAR